MSFVSSANSAAEAELKKDNRASGVMVREMDMGHASLIRDLKLQQEKRIMALRQEFERKADEIKQTLDKKMKAVREWCMFQSHDCVCCLLVCMASFLCYVFTQGSLCIIILSLLYYMFVLV